MKIYDVVLTNENFGIFATSFVESPAHQSLFAYFNEHEKPTFVSLSDEDKQEVVGALLIPDKLIYRQHEGQEFFMRFSKESIADINARMQQTNGYKLITIDHDMQVSGNSVQVLESWIKETEEDKSVGFGIEAPIGTLFVKMKVNSDFIWKSIKNGSLKGFSVEIDLSLTEQSKRTQTNMSKDFYKKLMPNTVDVNGTMVRFSDLKPESPILVDSESGDYTPFTGQFSFEGNTIVAEDGAVVSNEKTPEVQKTEMSEMLDKFKSDVQKLIDGFSATKGNESETIQSKIEELRLEFAQKIEKLSEIKTAEIESSTEKQFDPQAYQSLKSWTTRFSNVKTKK